MMCSSAPVLDHGFGPAGPPPLSPLQEQRYLRDYLPLVKRIVGQLALQASQAMDRKDMEQIGLIGLLECLRRYGAPDEGFGRFAALRVRGAILDELRRMDWRPRTVRQQAHKVRDVVRVLRRELGREPTDAEVQARAGLDDEGYLAFVQAEAFEEIESLDAILQDGHAQFSDGGRSLEDAFVDRRTLEQALARLDERERLILTLYYQHELTLKEIALVLTVTEARVCQLSKQALAKTRAFLTESK